MIRFFSYVSALLSSLTLIKSPKSIWGGVLWLPKLWAESWAPFLALMGGIGAVLGCLKKDKKAVAAGVLGAALSIYYTRRVINKQADFATVFGADWEERIPPQLKARLSPRRYTLIQPTPPVVPWQRNVVFGISEGTQRPLLCDLWQPPTAVAPTGLAVVYLHGGLWNSVDKDFLTRSLFRRLAGQGHVIMDVAYSLTPEVNLDQMLTDVRQAIVWLKRHATNYGINPERIVLIGAAGGAHLALLTAYAPDHPAFQSDSAAEDISVRAVVSNAGISDLRAFFREYGITNPQQPLVSSQITDEQRPRLYDKTWLDKFLTRSRAFPAYRHSNSPGGSLLLVYLLGGTLLDVPEAYRLGSPIVHAGPHCPPTLLFHGEDDFVIPVSQGRCLQQALRKAGAKSIYIEYPNTVHAFDRYMGVSPRVAPAAQSFAYDIERFLAMMV